MWILMDIYSSENSLSQHIYIPMSHTRFIFGILYMWPIGVINLDTEISPS